jgi:hypothetical protein
MNWPVSLGSAEAGAGGGAGFAGAGVSATGDTPVLFTVDDAGGDDCGLAGAWFDGRGRGGAFSI